MRLISTAEKLLSLSTGQPVYAFATPDEQFYALVGSVKEEYREGNNSHVKVTFFNMFSDDWKQYDTQHFFREDGEYVSLYSLYLV